MIVCWVLFAIGTVTAAIGYGGYRANHELIDPSIPPPPAGYVFDEPPRVGDMTAKELLEELRELERERAERIDRRQKAETFLFVAQIGALLAGPLLLWNLIWHTGHWIWMGRQEQ